MDSAEYTTFVYFIFNNLLCVVYYRYCNVPQEKEIKTLASKFMYETYLSFDVNVIKYALPVDHHILSE